MTHEEEIADLKQRIASQAANHKTRSGLTHRLTMIRLSQLLEESMATTTFTESSEATAGDPVTDDDAIMKTPEYRVGAAIRDLRSIILLIQDLRMNNETADYILRDYKDIAYCAEWLTNLSDDMRAAIFNSQIVDLRDKINTWHTAAE